MRHDYILMSFARDKKSDENLKCRKFELRLIPEIVKMVIVYAYTE